MIAGALLAGCHAEKPRPVAAARTSAPPAAATPSTAPTADLSEGPAPAASPLSPTPVPTPTQAVPAAPASVPRAAVAAVVVRIVDGDTVHLRPIGPAARGLLPGRTRVRLLEVDAPETHGGVECYGDEATRWLARTTAVGSTVWVAPDRDLLDRYGRTLLYIWTARGAFVNRELVRLGYAKAVLYPPNDRYIRSMRSAETEASRAHRGLWSACSVRPVAPFAAKFVPTPAPAAPPAAGGTAPRFGTCKAAKAAGYGPYYAGRDPEYDWYRDADHDGIVCE